jgi:hypothetical protein
MRKASLTLIGSITYSKDNNNSIFNQKANNIKDKIQMLTLIKAVISKGTLLIHLI